MALRDLSGAVDFTVLEAMTGGQVEVTVEVLDLYREQVSLWLPMIDPMHEGCRDALHTLRGASAAIGASEVVQACAKAEALPDPTSPEPAVLWAQAIQRLGAALDRALTDVAVYHHLMLMRSLKA